MARLFNIQYAFNIISRLLFILLFSMTTNAFALEQHDKAWVAINTQHSFSEDKKWLYGFYSQLRFINENHPLQTMLFEGGLGYQLVADKSLWLGYRWSGNQPGNHFFQMNRLVQALLWQIKQDNYIQLLSRSRLEEEKRSDHEQIEWRFRERLMLELKYFFFNKVNPYFYDEVFFQLNKTDFTAHNLISQNRLFLGINFYLSKTTWWEIGYINQFQYQTPLSNQNQMNHILSLTYYF